MEIVSAYSIFAQKILSGEEGVFFSAYKPGILKERQWIFAWGESQEVDFDDSKFPLFSLTDFEGKKNRCLYFKNWLSIDSKPEKREKKETDVLEKIESVFLKNKTIKGDVSLKKNRFIQRVQTVQEKQKNGEFWVLNLTQDLVFEEENDAWKSAILGMFYRFLKSKKSHCGGVYITNDQVFCSMSPEIFFVQDGQTISTFPIKGTGDAAELENSEKEVAELSMVTDLLRNDFGQICSRVETKRERFLTKENHFFHAQSEIEGRLKKSLCWRDFQKLLPAGSISGAPKKRVLNTILALEDFERKFYTGTFGVRFSAEKSLFNIMIRTLFFEKNQWHFPVGAGITIDSDPEKEFEETLLKSNVLDDFGFRA